MPTYLERTTPGVEGARTSTSVDAEDPPPLAVTLTEPTRSGDTPPDVPTVAMLGSALAQVNATPVTTFPFLSVTLATSWTGVPTTASVAAGKVTTTALPGARLAASAVAAWAGAEPALPAPPHAATEK